MAAQLLFAQMKAGSGQLWDKAQDHPFVHGLGDGSLDRENFTFYLKQDYLYLIAYSRAINLAAASAPDLKLLSEFTALAHETLNTEMALHRDYCTEFGITVQELEQVEASPICQAYSDFCISTAAISDPVGLLAALIPCGVGYFEIGTRQMPKLTDKPDHPYRQWIETYASAEFKEYADWMVVTLNSLGEGLLESRISHLQNLFNTGCRYEWLFWEMAWTKQSWPV